MKYLLIPAIILLLFVIYLNRSYAYFYNFQGDHFIGNPAYSQKQLFKTDGELETKKLAILGDSLMAGTGSTKAENSMAYSIAQSMVEGKNIELYNFAQPGVGIVDALQRQSEETIKIKPDYIVLMVGTNDVHNRMTEGEFTTKFSLLMSRLSNETKAEIIVINIPFIGSNKILYWPWNNILSIRIQAFNKIIAEQASGKENVKLVDLYTSSKDSFRESSQLYAADEFHPSDKGYKIWVENLSLPK